MPTYFPGSHRPGCQHREETLRAEQYEELLRRIMKKQSEVKIELKPTCAPQFMRIASEMGLETRFNKGCLAGLSYCIISPLGIVQPCAYLNIPAGNVREKPFGEIWREAEIFKVLRTEEYKGACGSCRYKKICGGCRARAYFYQGDYMGEEPWCLYKGRRNRSHAVRCRGQKLLGMIQRDFPWFRSLTGNWELPWVCRRKKF